MAPQSLKGNTNSKLFRNQSGLYQCRRCGLAFPGGEVPTECSYCHPPTAPQSVSHRTVSKDKRTGSNMFCNPCRHPQWVGVNSDWTPPSEFGHEYAKLYAEQRERDHKLGRPTWVPHPEECRLPIGYSDQGSSVTDNGAVSDRKHVPENGDFEGPRRVGLPAQISVTQSLQSLYRKPRHDRKTTSNASRQKVYRQRQAEKRKATLADGLTSFAKEQS